MTTGARDRGGAYASLLFDFSEIIAELASAEALSEPFTSEEAATAIKTARVTLESIRSDNTDRVRQWLCGANAPFRTKATSAYDSTSSHPIYGEVSSIWEIRRVRPRGPKSALATHFAIEGIASTEVRLFRVANEPELLAFWKIEVATMNAPGVHFHMQIKNASDAPPFPQWLSVPRYPTLFVTPMDAIEFCIGEIFGNTWLSHITRQTSEMLRWRKIHRERLERLLRWQLSVVDGMPSPWAALKAAKPAATLFTGN